MNNIHVSAISCQSISFTILWVVYLRKILISLTVVTECLRHGFWIINALTYWRAVHLCMRKLDCTSCLWSLKEPVTHGKINEKICHAPRDIEYQPQSRFSLTWFSNRMFNVWSNLVTMLCQCTFDACCLATIFEWMLLDDPLINLTLADFGACQRNIN